MLSFYVSGLPGFVFLNPLSLATDDGRSVLAVKGSLRRFAPLTALRFGVNSVDHNPLNMGLWVRENDH